MVLEQTKLSWWDKFKRIIAFFLCPEFRNFELKLEHMQEYASLVHSRWYKDVKNKEKGLKKLNRKINKLEKENWKLYQQVRSIPQKSIGMLGKETLQEEQVSHHTDKSNNSINGVSRSAEVVARV